MVVLTVPTILLTFIWKFPIRGFVIKSVPLEMFGYVAERRDPR